MAVVVIENTDDVLCIQIFAVWTQNVCRTRFYFINFSLTLFNDLVVYWMIKHLCLNISFIIIINNFHMVILVNLLFLKEAMTLNLNLSLNFLILVNPLFQEQAIDLNFAL